MSHYKQLLVTVDFSDPSIRALQVAIDIGTLLNAKLFIVHFVPMRIVDMSMEGGVDFIKEVHQSEMEEAKVKLEKFIKDHTTTKNEVEQHLRSGKPAAEVTHWPENSKQT